MPTFDDPTWPPKGGHFPGGDQPPEGGPSGPPGGGYVAPPVGGDYQGAPQRQLRPVAAQTPFQLGRKRRLRARIGRGMPAMPASMTAQPDLGAPRLAPVGGAGGASAGAGLSTNPYQHSLAMSAAPMGASAGPAAPAAPYAGDPTGAVHDAWGGGTQGHGWLGHGAPPGNMHPQTPQDPIHGFDIYDPGRYLDQGTPGGTGDLLDPQGNPNLYNALYTQGMTDYGDAARGAVNSARMYDGMDGLPYGVLAMNAERDALGGMSRNLASARTRSIDENAQRRWGAGQDYLSFLRQQYSDKHAADEAYGRQILEGKQQQKKPRNPIGISVPSPGGGSWGISF